MDLSQLFREHIAKMTATAAKTLSETKFDALVLGSGSQMVYYADDMEPPFRPNPHFASFSPLKGPHHAIVVKPGVKPRLIRWAPKDYWYERAPFAQDFWTGEFDLDEADSAEGVFKKIGSLGRAAFVGEDEARAKAEGFALNPEPLLKRLDWDRAIKTAYEVECLSRATTAGVRGHHAAREAFLAGESELAIHHAFVRGRGMRRRCSALSHHRLPRREGGHPPLPREESHRIGPGSPARRRAPRTLDTAATSRELR